MDNYNINIFNDNKSSRSVNKNVKCEEMKNIKNNDELINTPLYYLSTKKYKNDNNIKKYINSKKKLNLNGNSEYQLFQDKNEAHNSNLSSCVYNSLENGLYGCDKTSKDLQKEYFNYNQKTYKQVINYIDKDIILFNNKYI